MQLFSCIFVLLIIYFGFWGKELKITSNSQLTYLSPEDFVIKISKPDSYHGTIISSFYVRRVLNDSKKIKNQKIIKIGPKRFTVSRLTSESSVSLMQCCEIGDQRLSIDIPDSLGTIYSTSYDLSKKHLDKAIQETSLTFSKRIRGTEYSIQCIGLKATTCKCVPRYGPNFSTYTDSVFMIKEIYQFREFDAKESKKVQKDISKILRSKIILNDLPS